MKNSLTINEQNFTRTKKNLKKQLEKEGVDLPLSKIGEILSKSMGFQDFFEIKKNILNDQEINHPKKRYFDDIIYIYEIFVKHFNFDSLKIKEDFKSDNFSYRDHTLEHLSNIIHFKINCFYELYDDFLSGDNSSILGNLRPYNLTFLRDFSNIIYHKTGIEAYKILSKVMDDYHNVEIYYYIEKDIRPGWLVQPVDSPKEKGFYRNPTYNIRDKINFKIKKETSISFRNFY